MEVRTAEDGVAQDAAFDAIDQRIAEVSETLEACRRAMLLARVACLGGAVTLLTLILTGTAYRNVGLVLLSLAATFGGIVWYGASRTSREQARATLAELEGEKNELIDTIARRNGWREMTATIH